MQQLEIEYFFPLTEQIPLDLDYTVCVSPKIWTTSGLITDGTGYTFSTGNSWSTVSVSASQIDFDVETIEFKLKEEPNFIRKLMYKVMGIKWKIK